MGGGVDVRNLYQGRLKEEGKMSGWADFLIEGVERPSNQGDWFTNVLDTKPWRRKLKAGTILQIGLLTRNVCPVCLRDNHPYEY